MIPKILKIHWVMENWVLAITVALCGELMTPSMAKTCNTESLLMPPGCLELDSSSYPGIMDSLSRKGSLQIWTLCIQRTNLFIPDLPPSPCWDEHASLPLPSASAHTVFRANAGLVRLLWIQSRSPKTFINPCLSPHFDLSLYRNCPIETGHQSAPPKHFPFHSLIKGWYLQSLGQ